MGSWPAAGTTAGTTAGSWPAGTTGQSGCYPAVA